MNTPTLSNKKGKAAAQKEAKKKNATTLKFLMDGLTDTVKESVGEYTSSKYLWFKLEGEYQKERPKPEKTDHESEDKPLKEVNQEEEKQEVDSNKGMDSFDCNDSLCDEIENKLRRFMQKMMKGYQRLHRGYISP